MQTSVQMYHGKLNVEAKHKTIKLLEESRIPGKTQVTFAQRNDEMYFGELVEYLNICTSEDTTRKPQTGRKHLQHTEKGLVSRIYRELLEFNNKKSCNHTNNWAKDLNRHFTKKKIFSKQINT